jgi:hypothetical protein
MEAGAASHYGGHPYREKERGEKRKLERRGKMEDEYLLVSQKIPSERNASQTIVQ